MRRSPEVSIAPPRVVKYGDFIGGLAVPTSLNLASVKPLRGTSLFVIEPTLIFLIIDNLFGGDGRFHARVDGRDFTPTEQRIIDRLLQVVFREYQKAWERVYPLRFDLRALRDAHAVRDHRHADRDRRRVVVQGGVRREGRIVPHLHPLCHARADPRPDPRSGDRRPGRAGTALGPDAAQAGSACRRGDRREPRHDDDEAWRSHEDAVGDVLPIEPAAAPSRRGSMACR